MRKAFLTFAVALGPTLVVLGTASNVALAQTSAASAGGEHSDKLAVNPSSVRFLCNQDIYSVYVHGVVDKELDLSDEPTARHLLKMAVAFTKEHCRGSGAVNSTISVLLRPGDPATFTEISQGFPTRGLAIGRFDGVHATYGLSGGGEDGFGSGESNTIHNPLKERKDQEAAVAAQARHLEQQRQAAQRKQSEIAARSAAFFKANGVTLIVTAEQLAANPFAYQGKVVAVYGMFEQMTSATQGTFSARGANAFQVSGIPPARFTQQRTMVVLAGRVLGNVEVKLPILGPTLVPHLSFVGSVFCQEQRCRDWNISVN